jgi:hypothetical protein
MLRLSKTITARLCSSRDWWRGRASSSYIQAVLDNIESESVSEEIGQQTRFRYFGDFSGVEFNFQHFVEKNIVGSSFIPVRRSQLWQMWIFTEAI